MERTKQQHTPPSNTNLVWLNGDVIPAHQANISVMSHALHYGTSVFEGIRAYNTPKGPCFFRLKEHIRRLFDSAKIYRMNIPFSQEQLEQACKDIVIQNSLTSAYLRPLAFFGDIGLGIRIPEEIQAEVMIAAMNWGAYLGEKSLKDGVDVGVSSWNRLAANTIPTGAKAGGNYLSSILIANEATRHGYKEGIALDIQGYVSEGAGVNIFIIRDNVIYTPPITAAILPGITRQTVFTILQSLNYEVIEQNIQRESLYLADEILLCGTAAEITPVRSIDGIKVGNGRIGPITDKIQTNFFNLFNESSKDVFNWLTYI